jgi:hypothetical protein
LVLSDTCHHLNPLTGKSAIWRALRALRFLRMQLKKVKKKIFFFFFF